MHPPRSRPLSIFVTFFYFLATSGVNGEEANSTGVAVLGLRTAESSIERQIRSYVDSSLSDAKRLRLIPEETTQKYLDEFSRQENHEVDQQLGEAFQDFTKGKKLYENLSIDEAIKALSDSVRLYSQNIGYLHDNRLLLSSHLYLGMALYIRGRVSEGKQFIRQMVVFDPLRANHELPRREYPPKIVKLHNDLTQEVVKGPAGSITFRTEPKGASIYFDAVQQPTTPHEMTGIPVGEHFVTFELKGYKPTSRQVTVQAGSNKVEATLEDWKPFAPYAFEKRKDISTNEMLVRVGNDLNAPLLVLANASVVSVVDEEKVTLTGQIYDTRSKEFSKIVQRETSTRKLKKGAQDLAAALMENITNGGLVVAQISSDKTLPVVDTKAPVTKPAEVSSSFGPDSIFRKWWFWTAVGVVVVGVGGYFAATQLKSPADYNSILVDNPLN